MQLTGTLYNAGGPLANVTVVFEATATTMNGVLYSADAQFTTQEDGTYVIDLEAGLYNVYWIERGHRVRLGTVTADPFSEASLPEVLQADPTPVDSSAIQDEILEALNQMQADLDASTAARDKALQYRDEAEAARDAATVSGQVYADTAAGLAATGDGQYFKTPAASVEGFLTLYRNNGGVADPIDTYPSLNGLTAAIQAVNEKTTRLNRSFSQRPYNGESLRLDFVNRAFGQGSALEGVSQAYGFDEVLDFSRASTATYFDAAGVLQTAAIDEPRFDHDPATGEPLGVLIEESRTNHLLNSEDLSPWMKGSGVSVVSAPFGAITEHEITASATADGEAQVYDTFYNGDNEDPNTYSILLRKGSARYAVFTIQSNSDSYAPDGNRFFTVLVDFEQETTTPNSSGFSAEYSFNFYGGFCAITLTSSGIATGITSFRFSIAPSDTEVGHAYRARCSGGSVFFSAGQVERDASFPTSYIPTAGSAVTRSGDIPQRTPGSETRHDKFTLVVKGVKLRGLNDGKNRIFRSHRPGSAVEYSLTVWQPSGNRVEFGDTDNQLTSSYNLTPGETINIAVSIDYQAGLMVASVNGQADTSEGISIPSRPMLEGDIWTFLSRPDSGEYPNSTMGLFEYIPDFCTAAQLEEMTA